MRPRIARLRTGRQTASPGSARGLGPGFRLALAAALVLAAALGLEVPCRAAGLVIEAPYVTAPVGSSGSFDLLLVNTNPAGGASYNVAADSFELSLSGPVAVTFTDVSINTIVAPSRLKVYKAVFEPKVTQDASELGVGVVFVS